MLVIAVLKINGTAAPGALTFTGKLERTRRSLCRCALAAGPAGHDPGAQGRVRQQQQLRAPQGRLCRHPAVLLSLGEPGMRGGPGRACWKRARSARRLPASR